MKFKNYIYFLILGCIGCGEAEDINPEVFEGRFLEEAPTSEACKNLTLSDYASYDIPNSCLSNLLNEKFESNANWNTEDSNEYELDLTNDGRYYMKTDASGSTWFIRCLDCEEVVWNEDFQIEIEIELVEGPPESVAAIIWGGSGALENVYRFGISADESFQIDTDIEGAGYTSLVPLTSFADQAIERAPILTIRSALGTTFFFINQQLVHTIESMELYGNEVGLSIASGVEVLFDDLKIWKVKR